MSAGRPSSSPRPSSPQAPRARPRAATAEPRPPMPIRYPLASPLGLSLDSFSRRAGLHPDMTRRLVALGLLRASRDASGRLWLRPSQLPEVARIQRLRAGLSLNYAAIGLVVDLLDRIDQLEAELRRASSTPASSHGRTRVRPSAPPREKE